MNKIHLVLVAVAAALTAATSASATQILEPATKTDLPSAPTYIESNPEAPPATIESQIAFGGSQSDTNSSTDPKAEAEAAYTKCLEAAEAYKTIATGKVAAAVIESTYQAMLDKCDKAYAAALAAI